VRVMRRIVEPFLRSLREGPSRSYRMLDFVFETLYVEKVWIIKPHRRDDHRVPSFFYTAPPPLLHSFMRTTHELVPVLLVMLLPHTTLSSPFGLEQPSARASDL